jgi:hypothetical protein
MNEAETEYIAAVRVTAGEAQSRRAAKALGRLCPSGVLPPSTTIATKSDHLERATGIVRKLTEESRKLRRLCAGAAVPVHVPMSYVMVPAASTDAAPGPVDCAAAQKMHAMEQFAASQQYHQMYAAAQLNAPPHHPHLPPRYAPAAQPAPMHTSAMGGAWGYPVKPFNGYRSTSEYEGVATHYDSSYSVLAAEDKTSLMHMGIITDYNAVAKSLLSLGAAATKLATHKEGGATYELHLQKQGHPADGCADGFSDPESISSLESPSSPDCTYAECA